jgi:hypothetical protein
MICFDEPSPRRRGELDHGPLVGTPAHDTTRTVDFDVEVEPAALDGGQSATDDELLAFADR